MGLKQGVMVDSGRVRGLDGVRGLAALAVFGAHQVWPFNWMRFGDLGVEVFFVLSGYLIIGGLAGRADAVNTGRASLWYEVGRFFIRRAFRIFPAYYVTIAVVTLIAAITAYKINFSLYPYYLSYTTNLAYGYIYENWPRGQNLGHFWTLAIEEQFYLFLAPLFLFIPPKLHARACGAIIAIAFAAAVTLVLVGKPWFTLRMDSLVNAGFLALGGLVAQLTKPQEGRQSTPVALAFASCLGLGVYCFFVRPKDGHEFAIFILMGGVAGLLVAQIVLNQRSKIVDFLEQRPFLWVGRVSYAFYLYHVFVKLPPTGIAFKGIDLIVVANLIVTALIAQASWILIEHPALRLRDRLLRPHRAEASLPAQS